MPNKKEIAVRMQISTGDFVSRSPIDLREGERLSPEMDAKLNSLLKDIYDVLGKKGLILILNGKGSAAFDGWGFDYETRTFEFFWYFPEKSSGRTQVKKLVSSLIDIEKPLSKKDLKVDVRLDIHLA